VIEEHVTIEKTLEEILKNINKQVLKTKYTLNLGQLLQVILDIKHYILTLITSKPVLPKLVIILVPIDHQMVVI
jgi:hypothetical protein